MDCLLSSGGLGPDSMFSSMPDIVLWSRERLVYSPLSLYWGETWVGIGFECDERPLLKIVSN